MAVLGAQQLQLGNDCFWPRPVVDDWPISTHCCHSALVTNICTATIAASHRLIVNDDSLLHSGHTRRAIGAVSLQNACLGIAGRFIYGSVDSLIWCM